MIQVLFVGDGPRDEATLPPIVATLLGGAALRPSFTCWKDIRAGGYPRKVMLAIRQARDAGAEAIVAAVDADREEHRTKLKKLNEGRMRDRARAVVFPTALGCAVPHAEAWLLDDPQAVRRILGAVEVPSVRHVGNPKATLDNLRKAAALDLPALEVLGSIARGVDPVRCQNAKETGFAAFAEEVRAEIGPLVTR